MCIRDSLSFGNAMSGREEGHTIRHLVTFAAHLFVLPVPVCLLYTSGAVLGQRRGTGKRGLGCREKQGEEAWQGL